MELCWIDVLIHLLAYPLYQLLSTLRHEIAHAVAAKLAGYTITSFKFWPHRDKHDGIFRFGYVAWQLPKGVTKTSAHVTMAPYYVDVVLLVTWVFIYTFVDFSKVHWWLFVAIMLLVSPMLDMIYNVFKAILFNSGDWMAVLPRT